VHPDDDHARFERPRRHTRPRTKDRPAHGNAKRAQVVTIDRGRYTARTDTGVAITAIKARQLGRAGVVVGDYVRIVGDLSGHEGTLARIVDVEPRTTVLRRTADDDDHIERIVVANADQLVIVTALADPPPRPALIDRCLVAAFDADMRPIVILTKSDLTGPEEILQRLEPLDVAVAVCDLTGPDDLDDVRRLLHGHTSVLVGHSGVGKSTLVNALVPEAHRSTGDVNEVTGRGRHTSTSAQWLSLPFGGAIIDTPGFRSFGLAHVAPDDVVKAFSDCAAATAQCPRGCEHRADSPECGLDLAVTSGTVSLERVDSLRRILASRQLASDW
jgi:ribosome biogenesis GTPase / thiamine phosphate phosphatase